MSGSLVMAGDGLQQQLEQAVQCYAMRGHLVIPLRPGSKKLPRGVPYDRATNSLDDLWMHWKENPGCNIGIVPGPWLLVVDIDPRNGGDESWEGLCLDHEIELPKEVPTVRTGGGGRHYYLRLPEGVEVPSRTGAISKEYPGVEIKCGSKGHVVAPPSVHPDTGRQYSWVPGLSLEHVEPPEIPENLLKLLLDRQSAPRRTKRHKFDDVAPASLNPEMLREMLPYIKDNVSRESWLDVGMALHHAYGGAPLGREIWDEWSKSSKHYDPAELEREYASFKDHNKPITIGTLIDKAKKGGWKGGGQHLIHPSAPPGPAGTVPPLSTQEQAVEVARQLVAKHDACGGPGTSVAISGPPGMTKSTARLAQQVELLRTGKIRTAISAHPTRDRIDEMLNGTRTRKILDEARAQGIRVVKLVGRGSDRDGDFYCSLQGGEAQGRMEQMKRSACTRGSEHAKTCGYQRDHAAALATLALPGPLLLLTTIAKLSDLGQHLQECGRSEPEVTLDDPSESFGLFEVETFRRRILRRYAAHVQDWGQDPPGGAGLRDLEVARSMGGILRAVLDQTKEAMPVDFLASITSSLPHDSRVSLRGYLESRDGAALPFEVGDHNIPAFGRALLRAIEDTIGGNTAAVKWSGRFLEVARPNRPVQEAVRAGRACFLSVGPMPSWVAGAPGVRREVAEWKLANQVTRVAGSWRGAPTAQAKEPNTADRALRSYLKALLSSSQTRIGYLGTKNDHMALGDSRSPHHVVGHYGADHAGTDQFQGVEVMLVRRYRPHPDNVAWVTAALQGCLGLRVSSRCPEGHGSAHLQQEVRRASWGYCLPWVPRDPQEREVYRTVERQQMLNAIGRCRPLQNPGCRIIIFDRDAVEGIDYTDSTTFQDLAAKDRIGLAPHRNPAGERARILQEAITGIYRELQAAQCGGLMHWKHVAEVFRERLASGSPRSGLHQSLHHSSAVSDRFIQDLVRALNKEEPSRTASRGGHPIGDLGSYIGEPGEVGALSQAVRTVLDPKFRVGRLGLTALIEGRCGLPRRTVQRYVERARLGGSLEAVAPWGNRADPQFSRFRSAFLGIVQEVFPGAVNPQPCLSLAGQSGPSPGA